MKNGQPLEIRAGMVNCPTKGQGIRKQRCLGCSRLQGFAAAHVMCAKKVTA